MKKRVFSFSIGCLLAASVFSVQAEDTPHGLAVFGRLQSAPVSCRVLMSKYVINLHHSQGTLPSQEQSGNPYDDAIYIQLGGDSCDANEGYKNIGLRFIGTADSAMGNSLANTATGSSAAEGVGIRLGDVYGHVITPNSTVALFPASSSTKGQPTNKEAFFPLSLTLVQLKDQEATIGDVQTNMTVQIERL